MTQQIINLGAAPDDGQGDNLRTAFDKTNENFDQIWTAGPVGSNVQISGNTIATLQVNQDLALSPNGTGNIRLNNNSIPGANNTWFLGSATNQWRGVYANSITAGNVTINDNLVVPGDATIGGNLTVEGDTIQIGNIVTDTKTIQLSNTAANGSQANGSGITVGANDNIATVLYNSTSNVWTTNIGITATGNVTAPYFVGNGSQLTGITSYANANAVAYGQAGWAGNIIPSGNLVYSLGNATNRWSDLWLSGNTIQLGDLSLSAGVGGLTSSAGFDLENSTAANLEATGNITATNVIATEWVTGNIGVETQQVQFTDPFGISPESVNLLLNGGYLVYESNLGSAGGFVPSADDSESIGQSDRRWSTIYGNSIYGNIEGLNGNISGLTAANFDVVNISARDSSGVNIGAGGYNNLVVLPDEVLIQNVPLTVAGNILSTVAGGLNITANTVANGTAQTWNFGTDGDLTVPGNIVSGNARISLQEPSFDSVYITPVTDDTTSITLDPSGIALNCAVGMTVSANTAGNVIAWSFNDEGEFGLPYGGTLDNNSENDVELRSTNNINFEANAVVNIYTDTSGTAYQWQFGDDGNLNLPNGGSIIVDGGDGVVGPDGDNLVISWDNEELILRSVAGDVDVEADRDFNIRVNYDVGATDYLTKWVFGQDNEIINITGNSAIITEAGNLNLQGGRNTLSSGNVQITAVDNGVAVNTWTFDNTGNLTAPGNVIFSDNYVYSGNTFTSPETNGILKNFKWEFSDLSYGADTVTLQWNLLDTTFPQWYLTTNSQGNTYVFDGDAKTLGFLDNSINSGTVTFGTAANNGAGNSNDIELTTVTGNAYVRTGSNSWKFDNTGVLTVPGNIATSWLNISNVGNIASLQADVSLQIVANASGSAPYWTFNSDGNLFVPGSINGDNNGPLLIDGVGSGEGYISLPASNFGGEQIAIVNKFSLGNGIRLETNGGNLFFSDTGNLTVPGNISGGNISTGGQVVATGNITANIVASTNNNGTGQNIKVGDDTWLGDINISNTLSIRGQQDGANAYIVFGNASNVALGRAGTGPLTYGGDFSVAGNITGNTAGFAIGYRDIPQVSFTGNATIATTDAGKHFYSTQSSNFTLTIANNASQGFQVGAAITVVNQGTGTITIAQGTGVTLYLAGNATASNRSVATFGMATIMKVATDTWFINGTGVS